jgi:ubiquinone/menaquinone biosynthesis C-methylase UbiE
MVVEKSVPYADSHARAVLARWGESGYVPLMHLGEFDATTTAISLPSFERAQRLLTENTITLAGPLDHAEVLEVGCGFGGNLALICAKFNVHRIAGLDINRVQIEIAQRVVPSSVCSRVEWVVGDAVQLPWDTSTFDVVLAIECAFHFSSRVAFAREAMRVLRKGGRLVLTDIVTRRASELRDVEWLVSSLRTELEPVPDLMCSEGDWGTIATSVGFVEVHREDITASFAPSFEFILKDKPRDIELLRDRNDRGVFAIAAAVERGLLQMERWAFVSPNSVIAAAP